MHATGYRNSLGIPDGTVLVVGGGNTGFQIAKELSETHRLVLAVGSRQTPLPQRLLGRDLFWWLTKSRLFNTTIDSRLGRRLSTRETLIGSSPRELRRNYGVELKSRVVDANGRTARFEDGSELELDAVIWATGYRPDYSWIELPVVDEAGRLRHRRGVTDFPGLYFLGLTWQYRRGSALIGWVKDDLLAILFKAMSHQKLGESDQARGLLEEARQRIPEWLPLSGPFAGKTIEGRAVTWCMVQAALREAEALIEPADERPKPVGGGAKKR